MFKFQLKGEHRAFNLWYYGLLGLCLLALLFLAAAPRPARAPDPDNPDGATQTNKIAQAPPAEFEVLTARDVMARAQCAMLGPNAKADVTRIITHRLPMAEAVGAYKMFNAREDGAIKILLYPEGSTGGGGGGGN